MSGDLDADVIVVGAGIVGGLAAERLARRGKAVLMIEAGPRVSRWRLLDAYRNAPAKNDYDAFYPELAYAPKSGGGHYSDDYIESVGAIKWKPAYLRLVGGTTWHWSSAFWRFLPNDFRTRTLYGRGRDWPIGYDDIEPYYTEAERLTGCSGSNEDDQAGNVGTPFPPRSAPYPLPAEPWSGYTRAIAAKFSRAGYGFIDEPHLRASAPYGGRPACCGNNNCSPLCPIGAMFTGDMAVASAERVGARLMPDTVAVRLEKGANGRIAAVHTRSPGGEAARLTARAFVVAAHAIETPRLLLLSGVANRSDQVGRNLMSHPAMMWRALVRDPVWPGRGPVQQGGSVDWRDGPFRARHAAFKYHTNNQVPNLDVTERLLDMGVIGRELDERIRHDASRFVAVIGGMEMQPDPNNRIELGTHRDGFGLPSPRIRFGVDDYVRAAAAVIREDFHRFDDAFDVETPLSDRANARIMAASHPMGTAIMGADPATSVVDGDGRAHDHPNLFIAGSAVFASATVVNPTLTATALGLRTADRVASEA